MEVLFRSRFKVTVFGVNVFLAHLILALLTNFFEAECVGPGKRVADGVCHVRGVATGVAKGVSLRVCQSQLQS